MKDDLLDYHDDEEDILLSEASINKKIEKKKKFETVHLNNFHYPHLEDEMLQDLETYVKWHKEHPGTTTPRKPRGDVIGLLQAGAIMISDKNPDLVYTYSKASKGAKSLPPQFQSQEVGKNAEFTSVTNQAHKYEHQLRLKESLDFEDPWWNKSVKDQIYVHHIHEGQHDEESWEMDSVTSELVKQFNPEVKAKQRAELLRTKAEELAIGSAWGKKPRVSKPVWEDPIERSKFTENGTAALEGYTAEALEKNLEIALKEYEEATTHSIQITGAGLSPEAAELHQKLSDYRESLGGLENLDKMGDKFVNYATKVRKNVEGGGSIFDGKTGDFLDACMKSNPIKVIPMLMFGADPNTITEDDEPVFVMTMKKIIFSDASRLSEADRDTKERRNCLKIMDSLVQYGANINCLVTEDKITPLMIVSSAGHTELVQWLLSKGADANFTCPLNDVTALMLASKYGHPKCIAEIVRFKGNVNAKDKDGNTSLHYTAMFGQTRTAKFLLRIGANRFLRNKDGKRAAEIALLRDYFVTAQIIAGFCPPQPVAAPPLKYISDHLYPTKKQTIGEKISSVVGGLFRSASNLFGKVTNDSEGWFSKMMEKISNFGAKLRDFDYRDILSWFKKSNQVQPEPVT